MSIKTILPVAFTATADDIAAGLANNLPKGSAITVVDANAQPINTKIAQGGGQAPTDAGSSGASKKTTLAGSGAVALSHATHAGSEVHAEAGITSCTMAATNFQSNGNQIFGSFWLFNYTGLALPITISGFSGGISEDGNISNDVGGTGTLVNIPHTMKALIVYDTDGWVRASILGSEVTQAELDAKAPIVSPTFTGTVSGITKAMIGLGSAENTTDLLKPISTATQTALDGKSATIHNHDTAYTAIAHGTNVSNPHSVTKTQVNLGNCDNVSDINKPVSTAQQTALDLKVDKITGKGLSANDYTTAEQTKLSGIAPGAEVNIQPDWNQATTTLDDYIKNKPTIPAATVINNTLTSTSTTEALSAAQGKVLQDGKHELYSLGHPYATAATTHGHTVTTSSQYNADYAGWKAFQQNPSSISEWATLGSMAGLLLLELPSLVIFTRCALRGRAGDYPTRWKLEGSNDGSTFTTLLDKTAADESLQYSLGEKVFDFTNTVPYKFYRFNFTAWVGSNAGLNSIRWSHQGINILSNASLTDGSVSAQFDELRFDRVRLISNTDLNVLAVSGFYDGTNLTNAPGASTSWFYVEHLQHSNVVAPGWAMQKAYGLGSPNSGSGAAGTMYIRTLVNAVWSAWRTVTTT